MERNIASDAAIAALTVFLQAPEATLLRRSIVNPASRDFADPVDGRLPTVLNDTFPDFTRHPTAAFTINDVSGEILKRVRLLSSGMPDFGPRIRNTENTHGGIFVFAYLTPSDDGHGSPPA